MISLRTLIRSLGLMIVVALSLVVSADSSAEPCPDCPDLPPQPHPLVCPREIELSPAGPTREETPSPKVGKIADEFSVSSTGEAIYSLSLNVPLGRLGMEPHLALSYSSGSGEGPFGMGFGLSGLSAITRCASNVAQDNRIRGVRYDAEDNFCLDGLRLVPVGEEGSVHSVLGAYSKEYRTFPDTFRRVHAFSADKDSSPQVFVAETKPGRVVQYGEPQSSSQFNGRVMGKDGLVRAWAVTLESDRHSNTIAYTYRNTREIPGDGHTIVHLPERINYTGNTVGGVGPTHAVVFSTFYSFWHAPAFTGGMATDHGQRIDKIQMLGPGDVPVRTYNLTFSVGTNSRFRLEMVQECAGASLTDCRPPTRLDWLDQPAPGFTEVDTGIVYPTHPSGQDYTWTPAGLNFSLPIPVQELDPSYKWLLADVTGDGLSDLVVSQAHIVDCPGPDDPVDEAVRPHVFGNEGPICAIGNWNVAANTGGALSAITTWRQARLPTTFELNSTASFASQSFSIVPMDVDHDGRSDMLYYDSSPDASQHYVQALTTFSQSMAASFDAAGSVDLAGGTLLPGHEYPTSGVMYADMNGDGMLDAITCEDALPLQPGDHSLGIWHLKLWSSVTKSFPLEESIPIDPLRGCYLKNYIQIVDVDSDGKADLLIPPFGYPQEESIPGDTNHVAAAPNCGGPCQYTAIQWDQLPGGGVTSWRSYDPHLIASSWSVGPFHNDPGRTLFLDVNGDGLPDVVTVNPALPGRFWTYINTGNEFNAVGIVSLPLNSPPDQSKYVEYAATLDYDGDGQTDILLPMTQGLFTSWVVLVANHDGNGQFEIVSTNIPFSDEIDKMEALGRDFKAFRQTLIPRIADLNGDGRQDVVLPINGTFKLFLNTSELSLNQGPENLLRAVTDGMNPLLPDDVNTPPDPGFLPNITIAYGSLVDHATTVGVAQDSHEAEGDIYLPRSGGQLAKAACGYPLPCVVGPRRVVKSYEVNNGQNLPRRFSMRYRDGRSDRLGRGFLGFGAVITTDEDGHAGHAELYDNVIKDVTVLNKSADPLNQFPITTYPYAGQVSHAWSWVLGLPADPAEPSLPVTRMHLVNYVGLDDVGASTPRILVPTNGNTTYFTLAKQTKTEDAEAVYLLADADKPLPDFVSYYGGGAVTYLTGYNHPEYKRLENRTTSTISNHDPFGDVLEISSETVNVDDIRTVLRQVDNDTATWRLGEVRNETACSKVVQLQSTKCVSTDANYDAFGDVNTETTRGGDLQVGMPLPLQATTTYTRDLFGNVTNIAAYDHIEGHQRAACVGYDGDGMFPVVFGNGAEHFTYVAYDKLLAAPIVARDPNGLQTSWMHDSFGRTVLETRPDGTTTASGVVRLKDGGPGGWWALHTFTTAPMLGAGGADLDSLGRTVRSWSIAPNGPNVTALGDSGLPLPLGTIPIIEQIVSYDFLGRVESSSKPYLQGDSSGAAFFTNYEYDNLGRVLSVEAPWNATTTYSYHGDTVVVTAPGTSSTTRKDAWGRPIRIIDGLEKNTEYSYAHFGGLLTVTPPGNTPTTTQRDAFGRVIIETDPDRGVTNIVYDGFGERIGLTDAEHAESYDYDILGRMVVKTDAAGQTIWTYDDPLQGLGRLSNVVSPDGIAKSYTYESFGRVHTVELSAGADTLTTTLDYDAHGRLSTITLPPALGQQFQVSREYDNYGHLLSVKDPLDPLSRPYWELRQINGVGQTTKEQMNGGTFLTTRSYDAEKNTLERILTTVNLTTRVQDLRYTYDDRLNMNSRVDGLQIVAGLPLGEHFEHDALDRLTCSRLDTACNLGPGVTCPCNQAVTYKDNGNIDTKSDAGTYAYDPNHPHAVQFVGTQEYGYDNVGNQTTRPGLTIDYTPFDLPSRYETSDGVETLLEYDGDQTRVRKIGKHEDTLYFGDYERFTQSGSVEHRYSVRSDERVVAIVTRKSQDPMGSPGTRAYIHVDHLGSTEKVTDAAGAILERRSYDAFGAKRNPDWTSNVAPNKSTFTAGYTGHEDEEELGLVNMKGRIYDPRIARFLMTDPLVSHLGFSQSWNPYSYVMNSPLRFVDPSGFGGRPPITLEPTYITGDATRRGQTTADPSEYDRDPSVDRPRADSDQVKQSGDKDAGAPQSDDAGQGHGGIALRINQARRPSPAGFDPSAGKGAGEIAGEVERGVGDGVVELALDVARIDPSKSAAGLLNLGSMWRSGGGVSGLKQIFWEPGRQQIANAADQAADGDFRGAAASVVKAVDAGVTSGIAIGELGGAVVNVAQNGRAKWGNWKSRPTYGHTFDDHSSKASSARMEQLAEFKGHQNGQWTDNATAASFIADVAKRGPGVHNVPLPDGMGRSFLADGTGLITDMARVVVKPDGLVRTAFPYSSAFPN